MWLDGDQIKKNGKQYGALRHGCNIVSKIILLGKLLGGKVPPYSLRETVLPHLLQESVETISL